MPPKIPPKKATPSSSNQKTSDAAKKDLPCRRCGNPDHPLKECKKQVDLLNRTSEEIKQLAPNRREDKYPPKAWVGLGPIERFFKEADFRNWISSEAGRELRKQPARKGDSEHVGYIFELKMEDWEKALFPEDKCLRCNAKDHRWPMCTTRVSLKPTRQPHAWPGESTETRFRMERDFKSFVEGAIEPKPHSQFLLVDGGEGDLVGHFKPAIELPVRSAMPPQLNYGPLFVDTRATLSPRIDSQLVNSADMSAVPCRPGFAEMKGGKTVLTNHFVVDLPNNLQLFKYVLAGQRLDPKSARGKKKEEMERFIKDSPTLSCCRDDFATDDISLIISWKNLYPEFSDPVRGTVMEGRTFKDTKKDEKRVVELVFERCIDINSLKNHVQLSAAFGMECGPAIQALNILLLKGAAEDAESDFATFRIGNNRVFRKNGYDPMLVRHSQLGTDGWLLVCHRGYFSTITPGLGNILLNLNIATSVFFRPMKLDKFLDNSRAYFGINDNNWVNKVGRLLHGVRVWIAYDHSRDSQTQKGLIRKQLDASFRIKTIRGLGLPLNQQTFGEGHDKKTVFKYLSEEYPNMMLPSHGFAVSVNLGTPTRPLWYAPHTLHILAYQPFRPKLSAELQTCMINLACKAPEVSKNFVINEGLREIDTPAVINRNANRQTDHLKLSQYNWNLVRRRHLETPSHASIAPVIYIHPWVAGKESPDIGKFHQDFMNRIKGYMNIQTGGFTHYGFSKDHFFKEDDFRKVLTKAADKAKLVVFIASKDQGYEEFKKVADQVEGIQSICIRTLKFEGNYKEQQKPRNGNNWSNYVGNVSMKLNVKVGGVNHEVENLGRICPAVTGELPVMILGADVTHPSPGTVEGFPSIAAVVGSTDKAFGKYGGSLRLQYPDGNKKARETIMSGLMEAMVQERLDAYKKENGQYPDKILYYRDGVGEGQYKQIRDIEISAIRDACRAFSKKAVKITAVVTTKRHHTRLYPGGGATCKEVNRGGSCPNNVIPGTTVESSIVSPDKFDFFLVSHVGIKGTSRPTYYTVIENEMDFDAKGIQNFTNALCYTYVRATMGVSYAPPAYYADRLCERGRVYLRRFFDPLYTMPTRVVNGQTVDDFDAFKRAITHAWGGTENANPWHKNLNDTMFWM
ncbi:hypothetical protein SLS58_009175 [Diplodia intermedia]|uniref:Piwi domain-containing protein n=1 Tax=Diplodia intermedia TaxID=856260 RepID=A0ABR3TDY1_9PEZI